MFAIHPVKQNRVNIPLLYNHNSFLFPQIQIKSVISSSAPRLYCTNNLSQNLTHINNEDGKAKMVDISQKNITNRYASAKAIVYIGPIISKLIHENNIKKGDVLSISQISGIIGAKKTSELIPLCHNINLNSIYINAKLNLKKHEINIISKINCTGKTGVEMEALTAVSIAALTIYDMCKAISHDIIIKEIKLMEKSGGKYHFKRNNEKNDNDDDNESNKNNDEIITLKYKTDPLDKSGEKFYPLYV